jgi:phosphoribosylformylglycinamidine cyclo-ligase
VLPKGTKVNIEKGSWPVLPIFDFLQKNGGISGEEMFRTFNCGIGMVLIVDSRTVDDVTQQLIALGESPYVIGEVAARKEDEALVDFIE